MTQMIKTLLVPAAMLCTTLSFGVTTSPANAEPVGYESRSIDVRTDDVNLTTQSGRDTLDRRIESAARQVCGSGFGNLSLPQRQAQRECMGKARNQARSIVEAKVAQQSALAAK